MILICIQFKTTYNVVFKQRQKVDGAVMLGQLCTFYVLGFFFCRVLQSFDCNVCIIPPVQGDAEKRRGLNTLLVGMVRNKTVKTHHVEPSTPSQH